MKGTIDHQQPDSSQEAEEARTFRPYLKAASQPSPSLVQGVAEAVQALLMPDGINQALAILGGITHVERVYIFEMHPHPQTEEPAVSQRFAWTKSTATTEVDHPRLQNLTYTAEDLPQWYKTLLSGEVFNGLVQDFPDEHQLLEPQRILSTLMVPILVNSKVYGFISFDHRHRQHHWSKDEEAVLGTIVAMLGSVLAHRRTAQTLHQVETRYVASVQQLQQIAANVPGLIYQFQQSTDGSPSLLYASSACRELCELEPEEILADFQLFRDLIHPADRKAFEVSLAVSAARMQPWDWEGRIVTPSGQIKWVQGRSRPVQQSNGDILWDGLLMDISNRKQAEAILFASEKQLRKQNQVLVELAHRKPSIGANFNSAVQKITEAAARTLDIERVSVWLYNKDGSKIHCLDLYELRHNRHSQGMELAAVNYPNYFKTLEVERTIAVSAAQTDPRTQEFTDLYLAPLGITSMLDAPIWLGGQMVGIVCHEHIGGCQLTPTVRQWTLEEENFAGSIADLVALEIEARERASAEEALRKSEELYRTLAQNFPNGAVFLFDHNLRYLLAEGAGLASVGLSKELVEGKTIWEAFPAQTCEFLEPCYRETLAGQALVIEVPYNDRIYWLQTLPLRNEQGEIDAGMVVAQDITQAKQAEAALRESEAKFSKAFRCSPDTISISTLNDGRYLEVNEKFLQTSGYSREEVIGRTALELNIWANPENRTQLRKRLQEEGSVRDLEFEFNLKSGEVRAGLLSAEVINLGGTQCLVAVNHDITERKQVEIQLRLAAQRHRLFAEIGSRIRRSLNLDQILKTTVTEVRQFLQADRVFIGHTDGNGQSQVITESVDPHYPSILGWVVDHENYLQELRTSFAQDCIRVVEDTSQALISTELASHYTDYQTRAVLGVPIRVQGDELFGALIVNQCSGPRQWQPMEIELLEQLATQVAIAIQQAQLYEQVQALNANLERQVQERTQQVQQKMQELQQLNELKDEFLHAVSHDLRTPVMGTSLVLKNLLRVQDSGSQVQGNEQKTISVARSILERMIGSCDRQLSLINSLLETHSSEVRGVVLHYEPVQLSQLVQAIVEDLEPLLTKNQATLTNELSQDLPLVTADPMQLRRVFENLLTNALNHNPPNLRLTLKAVVEEEMIRCTIHDNGVGMNQDVSEHLFERYVRGSRTRSTGIGLGLYLCRQIITAHGGQIGVDSQPGGGATFWFTLPLLK